MLTSGCTLFAPQTEKVAKAGGKLVTFYCTNVTVPEIRADVRERVNKYADPHSVQVTCANDPSTPLKAGGTSQ